MEYKNILDILLMNNYLIYYLYLNDYLIQEFIEFDFLQFLNPFILSQIYKFKFSHMLYIFLLFYFIKK